MTLTGGTAPDRTPDRASDRSPSSPSTPASDRSAGRTSDRAPGHSSATAPTAAPDATGAPARGRTYAPAGGIVPAQGRPRRPVVIPAPGRVPGSAAGPAPVAATTRRGGGPGAARPAVTELRLSAFGTHRGTVLPLGPVTLLRGPSGSGKSTALRAYEVLAALGAGAGLAEALPDAADRVPEWARPDAQGRRGFRIGCTVDGPVGPVRLDVAVQAEPSLRIVGERLTAQGRVLLATALRDPGRGTVQAEWHTAGSTPVTRAPLPDDLLATALLPLRVAGKTQGQRDVLAAAEQVVVGLRSLFPCDPQPRHMRAPVPVGEGRLRRDCRNLAEVLHRTATECPRRHARLAAFAAAGCAGPVTGLGLRESAEGDTVQAVLERAAGAAGAVTPLGRLGDGELRYLALGLVLLTGPGVLEVDPATEVPQAMQTLTVLADGLDRGLDKRQMRALLSLAGEVCATGHLRLVATVGEGVTDVPGWPDGPDGEEGADGSRGVDGPRGADRADGAGTRVGANARHVPNVVVVDLGRDRT
ncbi:ATP-binding protein [Streptomyces sp. NPDC006339]|uniref:ATP-binding protein n=1 Tax=Streptomyces sp. NPDC006339 TaxID=3156755 RepID=UPI0033AC5362